MGLVIMDKKAFKIWLATNELNQKQLAEKLEITPHTISNYCKLSKFPALFKYALKGVEHEK